MCCSCFPRLFCKACPAKRPIVPVSSVFTSRKLSSSNTGPPGGAPRIRFTSITPCCRHGLKTPVFTGHSHALSGCQTRLCARGSPFQTSDWPGKPVFCVPWRQPQKSTHTCLITHGQVIACPPCDVTRSPKLASFKQARQLILALDSAFAKKESEATKC